MKVQNSSHWTWLILRFLNIKSLNSFMCLPANLTILSTVFLFTPTVSAVPLMLPPLTRDVSISLNFSYDNRSLKRGVPLFSEKVFAHVLHRRRTTSFFP
jgi:hypothetical protein